MSSRVRAAYSAAILVPAPGLFMTTTVRPRALPKDSPTVRATASEPRREWSALGT